MDFNSLPAKDPRRRFSDDSHFVRQWTLMLEGKHYDAAYEPFLTLLGETRMSIKKFNDHNPLDASGLEIMLRQILGSSGNGLHINQPFRCDYGCNIHVGDGFFANFNLTILDEAEVRIGRDVFIGPNVSIVTACHDTDPEARRDRNEWALPVTIGNDVWIGTGVTILPGVIIGDGCTIGAGSVVTKSIPPRSVAVGNPCRVIRQV